MWPTTVSGEVTGRIVDLLTTMQVLLGGVAVVTLLAAAAMTLQGRFRELGTLHALDCTTGQLAGASAPWRDRAWGDDVAREPSVDQMTTSVLPVAER